MPMLIPILIVILLAACRTADGPPRIEIDRTACAHCGMFVSERLYAAASQVPGAEARVFDDVACMLADIGGGAVPERVWVHDAETREWIDGRQAVFVHAATLQTPMGGGLLAFRDAGAARRAAEEHRGTVAGSLPDLIRHRASAREGGEP